MDDPIAYFLTWTTYGTWLPGDERGWIKYHEGWKLGDSIRSIEAEARMMDDACCLSVEERKVIEMQVAETCRHRGWKLYAVNCRSNHIHIVVGASDVTPDKIQIDIKAWCTRRLKEHTETNRTNWWTERGSQRYIFDEESLDSTIRYVNEAQDRKGRDHSST